MARPPSNCNSHQPAAGAVQRRHTLPCQLCQVRGSPGSSVHFAMGMETLCTTAGSAVAPAKASSAGIPVCGCNVSENSVPCQATEYTWKNSRAPAPV